MDPISSLQVFSSQVFSSQVSSSQVSSSQVSSLLVSPGQDPLFAFLDIGGGEFIVIVLVALVLFGGKLPDVARNVGRTVGNLKRQADELTREFRDEFHDVSGPKNPPRRYDPPRRIVPKRDPRSLGSDSPDHTTSSNPAHASDEVDDESLPVDEDGMAHAPAEELRRAEEDGFFHSTGDGLGMPDESTDDGANATPAPLSDETGNRASSMDVDEDADAKDGGSGEKAS